jgi:hypothetical protein
MKEDEYRNHIPTAKAFFDDNLWGATLSNKYKAANTPLPYILSVIPLKILSINPDYKSLRLINIFFSLFTLVMIYFLLGILNKKGVLLLGIILFYPYFLKPSFTYFMSIYGLMFFIISLRICYLDWYNKWQWFLIGFFVSLAILSQQFYLVLIPAYLIYLLISQQSSLEKLFKGALFISSFLMLVLPLFVAWGGLTHPNYSFHNLKVDLTKLSSILVVSGGVLFFYFLSFIKKLNIKILLISFLSSMILSFLFYPEFSVKGGFEKITGFSFHVLHLFGKFWLPLGLIFRVVIVCIGIYCLYDLFVKTLLAKENKKDIIFLIILMMMIIGFQFNNILSERHLLPLVVLLMILSIKMIEQFTIVKIWFISQSILGIIYIVHYFFFSVDIKISKTTEFVVLI